MKVTTEHYTMIKEQLAHVITESKVNTHKEFFIEWERVYTGFTEQRKVWDLYWRSGGADWIKKAYNGNPYGSPYNDNHLDTAIKKAYKELHKESM